MSDSSFTVTIPRLTTARLLLREFRVTDFDGYAENMLDPEATKYLSGPIDRRSAWRSFASATGAWAVNGAGWWSLEVRETGDVVGEVGVFLREKCPIFEIGWNLYRRFWGQGFAIEAARRALDFTFETRHVNRVIAHIASANSASIAVSRKLGMSYESDVDFFGSPIGRYAIER